MIKEIISIFKKEKFNIVCHNKDEWINIQLELFKKGFHWESSGKTIASCEWKYPLVIKNYRTIDRFGSKILIMDEYNFMIKCGKIDIKFTNACIYLRKEKLKKINNKENV